jgi:hypothetical protein
MPKFLAAAAAICPWTQQAFLSYTDLLERLMCPVLGGEAFVLTTAARPSCV